MSVAKSSTLQLLSWYRLINFKYCQNLNQISKGAISWRNSSKIFLQERSFASWNKPNGFQTPISIYNSLSNSKVPLIVQSKDYITWYTCGPTVYDDSHIGHARTYVCVDIIHRILLQYFNTKVLHVMNVTDIDDKIIKRANEQSINFKDLARKYETLFFKDMETLGVQFPLHVTRVSEYIPEIISYIQNIIKNKLAYVVNGSVYFDSSNYKQYGQLIPIPEMEIEEETKEKKNPKDFVLWKASKPNEPSWDSPWGKGRPGWHIECSAMCCSIFESKLDVHAGGIDLKFPHHENEIAQCKAHYNLDESKNWVNYFIHTGHLHIDGRKMSKSLKNFITIKEMLTQTSPNQFRIFCLLAPYNTNIDYSKDRILEAANVEKKFFEFFLVISNKIAENSSKFQSKRWQKEDESFYLKLQEKEKKVHDALCDNFNTSVCMHELMDLITSTHTYIASSTSSNSEILSHVLHFVQRILTIFGLEVKPKTEIASNTSELIDTLVRFRGEVKQKTIQSTELPSAKKSLLELSDKLRDELLSKFKVRIQDKKNEASIWTFVQTDDKKSK